MSGRFQVCTTLANKMMEHGWDGDIGFQQFLYVEDKVTKKIVTWLVSNLPKGDEAAGDMKGGNEQLFGGINDRLKSWKKNAWFPTFSSSKNAAGHRPLVTCPLLSIWSLSNETYAESAALPYVTEQTPRGVSVAASLCQHNMMEVSRRKLAGGIEGMDVGVGTEGVRTKAAAAALKAGFLTSAHDGGAGAGASGLDFDSLVSALQDAGGRNSSSFGRQAHFAQEEDEVLLGGDAGAPKPGETPAEAARRKKAEEQETAEREIRELEEKLASLIAQQEQDERENDMATAQSRQLEENIRLATLESKKLEEDYLIKKRTLELLDNPEENTTKLQEICDKTAGKLLKLATEWEEHRKPLIDDYRKKKGIIGHRKEEAKLKLAKVKEMRGESKQMVAGLRSKETTGQALLKELEKLPKDVKRASYVNRILDIIRNVTKQREEIYRVLKDIGDSRREVNTSSEKLQRSFAACDELVFKDAKKKPDYREVYKILVEMHEAFQKLDETLNENGKCLNQYDVVQAKISDMAARNDGLDMKRIAKDLKAIKAENDTLEVAYQKEKAKAKAAKKEKKAAN